MSPVGQVGLVHVGPTALELAKRPARWFQRGHKRAPEWPLGGPKRAPEGPLGRPKRAPKGPSCGAEGPLGGPRWSDATLGGPVGP